MHKLLVFDLDGTLAARGKGMSIEDTKKLKALEEAGYRIALCSGKPTYYLCGFARQLGLNAPVLIGENGGTFQVGVELPPRIYYEYPCVEKAREQIRTLKAKIDEKCGNSNWYQPNEIELTPFPKDAATFEKIQEILDSGEVCLDELRVYRYRDCFDMIPKNLNKGNGVKLFAQNEGIEQTDIIAFGDDVNDIPMLEYVDVSVVIGNGLDYDADYRFENISEALDFILKEKP